MAHEELEPQSARHRSRGAYPSRNETDSGWPARKRRNWIIGSVFAVAIALVGAGMVLLGISGHATAMAVPASSASASYAPAPLATAPFGASDPETYTGPATVPDVSGPAKISIPSIGVATSYEPKGLLPGKVLDLPTSHAAWYDQSAPLSAPDGSTVISGHVNTSTGAKGPLGGLAELQGGAPVAVTDADGTVHHFKIVSLASVDKDKLDPSWFTFSGKRQLVLITCGGEVAGHNQYGLPIYTHNTVAVAVPVES